jgi:hypothetical protein
MKVLFALSVVIGLMTAASAAPIQCSTVSTFQQLVTASSNPDPGCQDQDKIYSNWSGTLPGSTPVLISFVVGTLAEQHSVNIGDLAPSGTPYTLSYVVSVDPTPATANNWITRVFLDADAPAGSGTVTKDVYAWNGSQGALLDSLVSANGVPDITPPIHEKAVLIIETFDITTSAYNSSTNVFVQEITDIPEPATYALIGVGLIALAVRARRKT